MDNDKYIRNIDELAAVGSKWWPKDVRAKALTNSILQFMLDTQERFLSILKLADKYKPERLFGLLRESGFNFHLFIKHLSLLTDVGAEPLQRIN